MRVSERNDIAALKLVVPCKAQSSDVSHNFYIQILIELNIMGKGRGHRLMMSAVLQGAIDKENRARGRKGSQHGSSMAERGLHVWRDNLKIALASHDASSEEDEEVSQTNGPAAFRDIPVHFLSQSRLSPCQEGELARHPLGSSPSSDA